jgi:hypothetical protein
VWVELGLEISSGKTCRVLAQCHTGPRASGGRWPGCVAQGGNAACRLVSSVRRDQRSDAGETVERRGIQVGTRRCRRRSVR